MKNLEHSIREKLLNIAKSQHVDYQVILIRYFHERFLFRLSKSRFCNHFCLKGGALFYAYEQLAARPTMDVDFCANKIHNDIHIIQDAVAEICHVPCPEDGVIFDEKNITAEIITEFKDYHGIRIHLGAKLQSIQQNISMDFGFGDEIYPSPNIIDYPNLLDNMPIAKISSYPLESVIAEKFQCIVDLAGRNTRMKDYFDIYRILKNHTLSDNTLFEAIHRTFENRRTVWNSENEVFDDQFDQNPTLNKLWISFLRKIKWNENLSFSDVWSLIRQKILTKYDNHEAGCWQHHD